MAEAIQQSEEVVEPINYCCEASKDQDGNGNVLDLLSEAVGYTVYDYVLLENGEPCDCEENLHNHSNPAQQLIDKTRHSYYYYNNGVQQHLRFKEDV